MKKYIPVEITEWIKIILISLLFSVFIEKYIISITLVDGESMYTTINHNDRLIVSRLAYAVTLPKRGDIVIFVPPIEERENQLFVKRVIAVEGDRYEIKGNNVYINGELLLEKYILNNECSNREYRYNKGVVPKDHIFVMGDNRNNSNDSRTFGYVPLKNVKGKVITKIWPLEQFDTFTVSYPEDRDGLIN